MTSLVRADEIVKLMFSFFTRRGFFFNFNNFKWKFAYKSVPNRSEQYLTTTVPFSVVRHVRPEIGRSWLDKISYSPKSGQRSSDINSLTWYRRNQEGRRSFRLASCENLGKDCSENSSALHTYSLPWHKVCDKIRVANTNWIQRRLGKSN